MLREVEGLAATESLTAFAQTHRLARLSIDDGYGGTFGWFWLACAVTTIGLVATNARLTKTEINRVALMADDGFARAINPSHTTGDGDTVFALATVAVLGDTVTVATGTGAVEVTVTVDLQISPSWSLAVSDRRAKLHGGSQTRSMLALFTSSIASIRRCTSATPSSRSRTGSFRSRHQSVRGSW